MEASVKWPEGDPQVPPVTFSQETLEDGECVYHFSVDGEESSVTLSRDDMDEETSEVTYRFKFFGWQFGEADVSHFQGVTSIEWQGIMEDLEDLAQIQARKLMSESDRFLILAVQADFPGAVSTEDVLSNI